MQWILASSIGCADCQDAINGLQLCVCWPLGHHIGTSHALVMLVFVANSGNPSRYGEIDEKITSIIVDTLLWPETFTQNFSFVTRCSYHVG